MSNAKTKVLIVDDSASVRQTLADILNGDPEIEVMATACDPYVAAQRLKDGVPDVITLDIEMPRMDGITFLTKLMRQHPIPVVICSSLTAQGSETLLHALEAGAVEIITKPATGTRQFLLESRIRICDAVKAAAQARRPVRLGGGMAKGNRPAGSSLAPSPAGTSAIPTLGRTTDKLICLGASTGGTEALRVVLQSLPADCPGVLVVQHMPEHFTTAFAKRLNSLCAVSVKEAEDGDPVLRGQVLLAPGNRHMLVTRNGARYQVEIRDGPLVSRHRPSVDVLFRSAARHAGSNAIGAIMTGMGDDGAKGLLEMRDKGAPTFGQDEASCVVYGMPREAVKIGAVEKAVPLDALAAEVMGAYARLCRPGGMGGDR